MKILGIDTSCDDTCISVIKAQNSKLKTQNFEVLSNIVSSQVKLHAKYGGVYPLLAKREHIKNLPLVFKRALRQAQGKLLRQVQGKQFDLIGVTIGPGLEPCLWQGINFAKDLAKKSKKPIISINHIEAHILANFLNSKSFTLNPKYLFPAVCLVVSGGHTQLILMSRIGKYKLIGETRDDAAGECFDKTARILGLGYPGGPIVAKMATKPKIQNPKSKIILPRPMMHSKDYDFSFSGLKTAVLYEFKKQPKKIRKSKAYIRTICAEIQQAIIDVLIYKTIKAARNFRVKSIILGGGVAANEELRKQFNHQLKTKNYKLNFLIPSKNLCTDNAAMVAATAYFKRKKSIENWQKIEANANLRI